MWRIQNFEEVPSTNTLAKELLAKGSARHGDVLVARHQTAGRGRLGNRNWLDNAGESLLMTVVLEHWALAGAELAQYVCALAVLDALRELGAAHGTQLDIRLKWPNDILLDGRKVCGVLSEAVWHSNYLKGVVLGIGVNVAQTNLPAELVTATSLRIGGLTVSVEDVRDAVLRSLDDELIELESLPEHLARMSIIANLRQELAWLSHSGPITLRNADADHEGVRYEGITELAFLILSGKNGEVFTTNSGSIELPGSTSTIAHNATS
jgi:BirA family biotin operon repressor/biotin-[acetyl-CoA-carboxylase] ligase